MVRNKKIITSCIFVFFVLSACGQSKLPESPVSTVSASNTEGAHPSNSNNTISSNNEEKNIPSMPPDAPSVSIPENETVSLVPTDKPASTPQPTINPIAKALSKPDENTPHGALQTNGFALILHSDCIFSCDLPESWEYSISPEYSKSFYEFEGEMDSSIGAYFYYSETDPNACIFIAKASPAQRKPFEGISGETEDYSFADGGIGMRKLLNGEYYYKEYIYCPEFKYYVTLSTSKQDYLEHENELRAFLDGISFGRYEISPKASKNPDKTYQLHIWNEFLQAELTVRPGTSIHAVWEQESTSLIFRHLSLQPENCGTKLLLKPYCASEILPEDSRAWERCKLTSGLVAYRTDFEEDGQKGTEYQLKRSECRIKIYGEQTAQTDEILQSVDIR